MSELQYLPLFVREYLAKTVHLSLIESGAYLHLLMHASIRGGQLPDEDEVLAACCKLTLGKWRKIKPRLTPFWQIENGMWRNRRLSKELKFIAEKNFKRKQAGAKGGTQKQQNQEHSSSNAIAPTLTPTLTPFQEDSVVDVARARDLEAQLREAAGWQHEPAPNLFVTGPIQALIDNGADLDLDVLPVVKANAHRANPTGWKYFIKPIARARDDRLAAATIVNPTPGSSNETHRRSHPRNSLQDAFAKLDAVVDEAIRRSEESGETNIIELSGLRKSSA